MPQAPRFRGPLPGRGTQALPTGRFESLSFEPDPEDGYADDDAARPRTEYLVDHSRTLLARNQSPDIGFEVGINPYRGCSHGCVYCLAPETPVLYADLIWRPLGDVQVGDRLIGFDERPPQPGQRRRWRPAQVEAVWWSRKRTTRIVTPHADVRASEDHRWLQERSFRWTRTDRLEPGRLLRRLPMTEPCKFDDDYRAGYLTGMTLGDGTMRYEPGQRSDKLGHPQAYWRVALKDDDALERCVSFLAAFGIEARTRPFDSGSNSRTPMRKVEIRSLPKLAVLHELLSHERAGAGYRSGYLAGFFDAEGHNGSSLRISQKGSPLLRRFQSYAQGLGLGLEFDLEAHTRPLRTLRLRGSLSERMRFLAATRPAIQRKVEAMLGGTPPTRPEPVVAVEPGGTSDVVDIQTSTRTFYAAGMATHNCYARPYHEFLGWSAGLDFETKILVKHEAPALLRQALSRKRWEPKVIALSGATDCYQPVERKLGITRRCLEVLAEFRNPVGVITKSRLVARDADVLADLARHQAVSVTISLTTLEDDVARRMEPQAAQPRARLAAIEALAAAGVPVGVNVAPIVPGLTDHEIPAILRSAADAGAGWAGYIMLKLPHGVKDLFEQWLEDHFPERKRRVLSRVRQVRGGQLNDPRFGTRQRGEGVFADHVERLFELSRTRAGLAARGPTLSTAAFRRTWPRQMTLF